MSKIIKLPRIGEFVKSGMTLAIGGFEFHRRPMALLYELIRQGCTNLTIQGWNNGNEVDLLVGARCVNKVETSYVGMVMFRQARAEPTL